MANGFLCTQCGWQETDHSGKVTEWTEADLEERRKIKRGYRLPLLGRKESDKVCGLDYVPPQEELALYKKHPELAYLSKSTDDDEGSW